MLEILPIFDMKTRFLTIGEVLDQRQSYTYIYCLDDYIFFTFVLFSASIVFSVIDMYKQGCIKYYSKSWLAKVNISERLAFNPNLEPCARESVIFRETQAERFWCFGFIR